MKRFMLQDYYGCVWVPKAWEKNLREGKFFFCIIAGHYSRKNHLDGGLLIQWNVSTSVNWHPAGNCLLSIKPSWIWVTEQKWSTILLKVWLAVLWVYFHHSWESINHPFVTSLLVFHWRAIAHEFSDPYLLGQITNSFLQQKFQNFWISLHKERPAKQVRPPFLHCGS